MSYRKDLTELFAHDHQRAGYAFLTASGIVSPYSEENDAGKPRRVLKSLLRCDDQLLNDPLL